MISKVLDWLFNEHTATRRGFFKSAATAAATASALGSVKVAERPEVPVIPDGVSEIDAECLDEAPRYAPPIDHGIQALMGQFVDRSEWVYWDVIHARGRQPLPRDITAFSIPRGSYDLLTGVIRMIHDTNAIAAGNQYGFGTTRCLILQELGLFFPLWMSDGQIDQILSSAVIEFRIAEKCFYESRLDIREFCNDPEIIINKGIGGAMEGERFDTTDFSARCVKIRSSEQFVKYIAPMVPFQFHIGFDNPPTLDFEGVKPVIIATMRGLGDRAIQ